MKFFKNKLFDRTKDKNTQIGLEFTPEGMACVSVTHLPKGGEFDYRLDWCEFSSELDLLNQVSILRAILNKYDVEDARINLVLHPQDYDIMLVPTPNVPEKEIKEAIKWAVKDQISIPVEEAVVDCFVVPRDNSSAGANLSYAVVAKQNRIMELALALRRKGLEVMHIDIPELCTRNIANLMKDHDNGVGIVRFDEFSSVIEFIHHGHVFLSRKLGIKNSEISTITEEKIKFLLLEIQRSLDYYESRMMKPPIDKLYVAPSTNNFATAVAYIDSALVPSFNLLHMSKLVEIDSSIKYQKVCPSYGAIGAAFRIGDRF